MTNYRRCGRDRPGGPSYVSFTFIMNRTVTTAIATTAIPSTLYSRAGYRSLQGLPGTVGPRFTEAGQRGFYRYWAELMGLGG